MSRRSGAWSATTALVGQNFPTIQGEIEALHRQYPGPTVVEANSIGLPIIQNLHLPESELIEQTTTQASKERMLTELEILLQEQTLKIHPEFQQLLTELADYRLPDSSITQDSVMALGFAVLNRQHAHAIASLGRINSTLLYELNNLPGPPPWWLDQRKLARGPTYGLVRLNPPPDCAVRGSYLADALTDQLETMLAQGWTVNDPADLDKLDPADLDKLGLGHLVAEQ
jgi:hypothetical protein